MFTEKKHRYWPFLLAVALNIAFVITEAIIGAANHSMSLISDAGHNLSDSLGMLLFVMALWLATLRPTKRFTYGYKKLTILISLFNSLLLIFAVSAIIVESILKLRVAEDVSGEAMTMTAAFGLAVNVVTVYLLYQGQKEDIGIRTIFLHKMADIMVSLGVLVSGLVISYTGWTMLDRVVSLVIAVIVLIPSIRLLITSVRLSLDGVPEGVDIDKIRSLIESEKDVILVRDLHVWPLSTQENALTATVVVRDESLKARKDYTVSHKDSSDIPADANDNAMNTMETTAERIRKKLKALGINDVTIEVRR